MCCGHRRRMRERAEGRGFGRGMGRRHGRTGNTAFDDYREEVLAKLEEEREAFSTYIDELRRAKDREEFESFRADRERRKASEAEGSATL